MKITELIGDCYYYTSDGTAELLFKVSNPKKEGLENRCSISYLLTPHDQQYLYFEQSVEIEEVSETFYREATEWEIEWLEVCRKLNTFISKEVFLQTKTIDSIKQEIGL